MQIFSLYDPMALSAMLTATLLSAGLLSYALSLRLVGSTLFADTPNGRSNHVVVTSRGGGVAVYGGWAAAMLVFSVWALKGPEAPAPNVYGAFVLVCAPAFLIGLADDRWPQPALRKLLCQIAAAVLFVIMFGGVDSVPIPFGGDLGLGAFGPLVTAFWIVALMNAFNFMDGINGIAALTAVAVLGALAGYAAFQGDIYWAMAALMLAAALVGFAVVNFPSGKIFLGDGGSLFVSFAIAALSVLLARGAAPTIGVLFAPIALIPFLYDVAFTLAHRLWRGERIADAHRQHLYQLLVQLGWSHVQVTCFYLFLTFIACATAIAAEHVPLAWRWFAPFALAVAMTPGAVTIYGQAARRGLLPMLREQAPESAMRFRRRWIQRNEPRRSAE